MAALEVCIILLPTHPPQMLTPSLEDDPGEQASTGWSPRLGVVPVPTTPSLHFLPSNASKT